MSTENPFASFLNDGGIRPKFLTAPAIGEDFELPTGVDDGGAPTEDDSVRAVVGEPELAALAGPSDVRTLRNLSTLQAFADGSENEILAGLFETNLLDDRPESPRADLELSPAADRELAPANDAAGSVDLSSTLNAIRAFLGGRVLSASGDSFSFARLADDEELAPADDSPLDPFLDAIDPAWVGEIMATMLPDGTMLLPDGTISSGLATDTPQDPMADTPIDGPDGWVV